MIYHILFEKKVSVDTKTSEKDAALEYFKDIKNLVSKIKEQEGSNQN